MIIEGVAPNLFYRKYLAEMMNEFDFVDCDCPGPHENSLSCDVLLFFPAGKRTRKKKKLISNLRIGAMKI